MWSFAQILRQIRWCHQNSVHNIDRDTFCCENLTTQQTQQTNNSTFLARHIEAVVNESEIVETVLATVFGKFLHILR